MPTSLGSRLTPASDSDFRYPHAPRPTLGGGGLLSRELQGLSTELAGFQRLNERVPAQNATTLLACLGPSARSAVPGAHGKAARLLGSPGPKVTQRPCGHLTTRAVPLMGAAYGVQDIHRAGSPYPTPNPSVKTPVCIGLPLPSQRQGSPGRGFQGARELDHPRQAVYPKI